MELINGKLINIRTFEEKDLNYIGQFISSEANNKAVLEEYQNVIASSYEDDFDGEGEKHFAIDKEGELIGQLTLIFEKPYIYFSYTLNSEYDTRIYIQDLVLSLIKYLHLIYHHRQIITTLDKFNLVARAVVENLGFERKSIDKLANTYTYSIFVPNPNKGK